MDIRPYLFLSSGRCREAFTRYHEILGGDLEILTMADAPAGEEMPGSTPDTVMHAALKVGDALLMGSDDPTGDGGPMRGVAVTVTFDSADEARAAFEALAEGGEVQMPFEPTFFSAGFGACVDRFGVPWQVDTAGEPPAPA